MTALSTVLPNGSPSQPAGIPAAWVDRLFERLAAFYGRHWLDLWADVPIADVKDAWQTELAGVTGDQIRKALAHLVANNKFPPTLPEFVALCQQYRAEPAHRLALPIPRTEMPAEVRDKLRAFVAEHRVA